MKLRWINRNDAKSENLAYNCVNDTDDDGSEVVPVVHRLCIVLYVC